MKNNPLSVCNHTPTTIASVFLRLGDQTEGGAMDGTSVNGRPQKESTCDCSRGRSAGESGFKHTRPSQRLQRRGLMKGSSFHRLKVQSKSSSNGASV